MSILGIIGAVIGLPIGVLTLVAMATVRSML